MDRRSWEKRGELSAVEQIIRLHLAHRVIDARGATPDADVTDSRSRG
jgi:hypothetical protein